jgi:hypothetical protein
MNFAEHPTVRHFHQSHGERPSQADPPKALDATWLRQLCLDCGADDAGLVEIRRPAPDDSAVLVGAASHVSAGEGGKTERRLPFTFTGTEEKQATVTIRDGALQVQDGHQGEADLRVTADSETWLGFLAKERSLLWVLLRRRIRIKGSPKLLVAFGKCFPS